MRIPVLTCSPLGAQFSVELACGHLARKIREPGSHVNRCDKCTANRICGHLALRTPRLKAGIKYCADCSSWRARELVRNRSSRKPRKPIRES